MTPRYAIYFTPPHGSPLERFGAAFLGYDAFTATDMPASAEDAAQITVDPRRYGFHATLKAPLRLAPDQDEAELIAALRNFADTRPAVALGELEVSLIGGFIALTPVAPTTRMMLLAAECVATFDDFRAPMPADDRETRVRKGLNERQIALLDRWGYPYVFDEFRLHMTLTGSLPREQREPWKEKLSRMFAPLRQQPVMLDAVSLFRQDDADARFRVIARVPLQR